MRQTDRRIANGHHGFRECARNMIYGRTDIQMGREEAEEEEEKKVEYLNGFSLGQDHSLLALQLRKGRNCWKRKEKIKNSLLTAFNNFF